MAVLDFASLYPSVIIAHNLCYSTCLGRVQDYNDPSDDEESSYRGAPMQDAAKQSDASISPLISNKGHLQKQLGPYIFSPPPGALSSLVEQGQVVMSPNGALFAAPGGRAGVLPRMLHGILQTREMIKKSMKAGKGEMSAARLRLLDARQFALKMVANVTYGYTSASFSGRMPCVELADAIVDTGKRTLEASMRLAEQGFPASAEGSNGIAPSLGLGP